MTNDEPDPAASWPGHETRFATPTSEDLRVNHSTKAKPDVETPADFHAVAEDLAALKRDFATLMNQMSQMRSGAFKVAGDAAESTLGEISDRADRLYDSLVAQGERSVKAIGRQVEERPVMSLLIAFGVGFIVSRLLSR